MNQHKEFGTVNLEIFVIFSNNAVRHICYVQISRVRCDLPMLVNHSMILLFREGLNFMKLRICICEVSQ